MNSHGIRVKAYRGYCCVAWSILALSARGQTSQESGEALEQSNLTWVSTGWSVRAPVRGRLDVLTGSCPADAAGPQLQTTITGPAKLVFDWAVHSVSEVPVLGLSVDGHELALKTPYPAWRCVELQIPAGTHDVAWRPLPGATIYLDNVIYDAGQTMGFVLAMGDGAAGIWAVHTGSFGQTAAAARDGLTSAAQLQPDEDGAAVAYRLTGGGPTEAVGITWWQRQMGNGHGVSSSPILSMMGEYDDNYSSWHFCEKVAAAGTWIKLEGTFLTGVPLPGALYVDDFNVEIRTLSWALDTPKRTWQATQPELVPWRVAEGSAPHAPDGLAAASLPAPYEATLSTTIQGPVLFAISHRAISDSGLGMSLSAILDGTELPLFNNGGEFTSPDGPWMRDTIAIPQGTSTLALHAIHTAEGGGSWFLDQCNRLTLAPAPVSQALQATGSALEVWSTEIGGVTRDGTTVRNDSATACLTPERERVTEIVVRVQGPAILSYWAKAEPGTTLEVCAGSAYTGNAAPAGGGGWELKTVQVSDGPQYVHLIAGTGRIWLDDLTSIYAVPIDVALDVTSDIPGMAELTNANLDGGYAAQLPQGSGAAGDDAVIFPTAGGYLFIPFNTFPVRIRFRHLGSETLDLMRGNSREYWRNTYVHAAFSNGPAQWNDADIVMPQPIGAGKLIFYGRGVWLDQLRIHTLEPRPWEEAGIPTTAAPSSWQAFNRADRNDGICAMNLGSGGTSSTLALAIPGPCDVSALWRLGRRGGPAFVIRCGAQSDTVPSTEWQRLHLHMDEPVATSFVVQGDAYNHPFGGEGMLDDVSITPRNAMTFSHAMDTDAPAEGLQSPGWTAMGTAVPSVETAITFDGTDAIAVRPDPGISGLQHTTLRAGFGKSGFFHLRARQAGGEGAACVVTWTPGSGPRGSRTLALSADWSLLTECVSASAGTEIQLEVTVDGSNPASAVYLDTFGWEATPSTSELLESPAFSGWVSVPPNAWTGGCHPIDSGGSAPAMEVASLGPGTETTLTGSVTGPGFVVFSYTDRGFITPYTLEISVGGTAVLSKARAPGDYYGPDKRVDQIFVPAGTHQVSWTVRAGNIDSIGPFRLLSVALVPGSALSLLTERLPASAGWRFGGASLPQPLFDLTEGVLVPTGVKLPVAGTWIERDFTGPSEVSLGWYSDTSSYFDEAARFMVDGQDAGRTYSYGYESISARTSITKNVSIPPGVHRFRWERVYDDSASIALGPCIAGPPVISSDDVGPFIWVNESTSEFRWRSVTGNAFSGTTSLSARDTARGECLINGPGVLSFMLAQDGRSIFRVEGKENQDSYYFSSDPHGFEHISLIIPPGPQRLTFIESYCEPTDGTEIAWIDDMKFTPSGFARWRSTATNTDQWGANWLGLDSDNDGVVDELEYAFGTNAVNATPEAGPACTCVDGKLRLQFPALPYDTTGLRYSVETSLDMLNWVETAVLPANAPNTEGPSLELPETSRKFVRTKVTLH